MKEEEFIEKCKQDLRLFVIRANGSYKEIKYNELDVGMSRNNGIISRLVNINNAEILFDNSKDEELVFEEK